jgi:hypothetical protein
MTRQFSNLLEEDLYLSDISLSESDEREEFFNKNKYNFEDI